jgi:hypothetical protein
MGSRKSRSADPTQGPVSSLAPPGLADNLSRVSFRPALALWLASLAACTWAMPADSRITAVTVYADTAVVTRSTTLDLPSQGKVEVTFENLPATLVDRSLKAIGHGTAQARVLAVTGRPGTANRPNTMVAVDLAVTSPGSFDLTLSYAVPGASWTPAYEARALPAEHLLTFDYFALVSQNTGENWANVDLTLSTLNVDGTRSFERPARNTLAPFVVHPASRSSNVPLAPVMALVIPAPSNVSDGAAPAKVTVASRRLASENAFFLSPVASGTAFATLTARATNSFEFPLLPGEVKLLSSPAKVTRPIRTVMPGKTFELVFPDKSFAVTGRRDRVEDDGPLHQSWRINYEITLTVQNNLPIAEKVVLGYGVPRPGIDGAKKEIVIKLLAPTAPEAKFSSANSFRWDLTLAPGEIRDVPAKFSIEFLDMPVRQGHVKIGELQIVDDRAPTPGLVKP